MEEEEQESKGRGKEEKASIRRRQQRIKRRRRKKRKSYNIVKREVIRGVREKGDEKGDGWEAKRTQDYMMK